MNMVLQSLSVSITVSLQHDLCCGLNRLVLKFNYLHLHLVSPVMVLKAVEVETQSPWFDILFSQIHQL